jgi:hypothetical protein
MGLVSKEPEDEGEEEAREVLITGFGQLDDAGVDEIELDLADWSEPARAALDERLHLLEAPHEWNGTWLVVPEDSADWVERIIDQVEEERSVELDPEVEQIAYDLAGWDDGNRALLLHALEDEAIAFALEDDELIVHEIDEQRVDELVDAIVEPDAPPSGGGEARTEVMGELFVAADRLVHDPRDTAGQRAVRDGAQEATTHAPPYGMDKGWWESLGAQCAALVALFDAPSTDEDPIVEAATALRDVLRPYV